MLAALDPYQPYIDEDKLNLAKRLDPVQSNLDLEQLNLAALLNPDQSDLDPAQLYRGLLPRPDGLKARDQGTGYGVSVESELYRDKSGSAESRGSATTRQAMNRKRRLCGIRIRQR